MSLIEKALGRLYWLLLNLARISPAGSSWGLIFSTYVYLHVTIQFLFQQIRNSGSSTLLPFFKLNWLEQYSTFGWCFNSYMLLHTSSQQPSGKWQLRNYYAHFTDKNTRGPVTCLRSCTVRKWWSLGLKTLDSKSKPSHYLGLPLRCLYMILK